jgi:hypothetical protein
VNDWQLFNVARGLFENQSGGSYDPEIVTRFDCEAADVVNAAGVPMRVSYCLNGFVRFGDVYELDLKVVTMDPKRPVLVVGFFASGFTPANVGALTQLVVDGIRPVAAP